MRTAILIAAVCVAAFAFTSCVEYPRPYAGYYSAGYGAPYGYGYPSYGYPYGGYGYGGTSIVISGARYRGYRSPYYRDRYYPRQRVQNSTTVIRRGGVVPRSDVRGSRTRKVDPRTQATVPQ